MQKKMSLKNILIFLSYSAYIFNILPMQLRPTSNTRNLHGTTDFDFTSSTISIRKITLDKSNFKDKSRKVKQPQCLYCERFLNEPHTTYKCDACKGTKIEIILAQRFSDKIYI